MSTRYVALLRGIYPSGKNMGNDHLRGVFAGLGFTDVASVQASGNILFTADSGDAAALEDRIDAALADELGLRSTAILRSARSLASLVASDPFPGLQHGRATYLTATFVKLGSPLPDPAPTPPEGFATNMMGVDRVHGVLLSVTDNSEPGRTSGYMAWLGKTYGRAITTRSWPTVERLKAKLEA